MFKFINPRLEIAHSRIRELELSNERLLTEVAFLREELTDSKQESKLLIDRIFDMTGVNKPVINQSIQVGQQPIQIGTKRLNWTNQRQTLEDRAKEVYYLNKNKETEAARLLALEKEVGISIDGGEDASKVS